MKITAAALSCTAFLTGFASCGRDLGDLTEPEAEAPTHPRETIIVTMNAEQFSAFVSQYPDLSGMETVVNDTAQTTASLPAAAPSAGTTAAPAAVTSQSQTPAASASPMTYSKEQLLTYFNNCVNKIKQNKPGLTREKQTKVTDIQLSNSMANSLVSVVKNSLLSEDLETKTVEKGQNCNGVVSREGADFVSALTLSDIGNITVTPSGGGYTMTVTMPEAVNPDSGSGYAKIFQFITVDDVVSTYAPKVGASVAKENISVSYKGCTAVVTVDEKGNPTNYETYVACVMTLKDASIKKGITIQSDVDVTLSSATRYKNFAW